MAAGGPNRTVAETVVAALDRHGVELMVGQSIPTTLYLAAPEYGIRQVTIRTEKAGAMLADGYARITHKVPVVTSIGGPGTALLVPGLAEAYKASIPVVALVQDTPRGKTDRNAAQEIDQVGLLQAVTKLVRRVETADRVEDYIDLAFATAASGRPGPVALLLPEDLLEDPAPVDEGERRRASLGEYPLDRTVADPVRLDEAADLIARAALPIAVAGGGVHVSQAHDELAHLQELAAMPVATTNMGKGAVDETHPLSLGVIGYAMGRRSTGQPLRDLIARADVLFLVGNRTNQTGTDSWSAYPAGGCVIHLDIDGQEVGRNYEALRLVGDAKLTLRALGERLGARDLGAREARRGPLEAEIAAARDRHGAVVAALTRSEASSLRPERVMAELERLVTPETVVVADASYATIWVANYMRARRPGMRFLSPRGLAGIGWGFPIALGAKLGAPQAPVLCLVGDGGFAHGWAELETARRHDIRLVVLVLNNQVLGYQKDAEDVRYGTHTAACHFGPVDHAAIARACGWTGIRVETAAELAPALVADREADGPALIDIMTDPAAYPPLTFYDGHLPEPA